MFYTDKHSDVKGAIGWAVKEMKRDGLVYRAVWSGKYIYMALVTHTAKIEVYQKFMYTHTITTYDKGTIGWAVKEMKRGSLVCRAGWNGKNMWIALAANFSEIKLKRVESNYPCQDFVVMKTAQDTLVPWLCSQSDLLAVDWEIYNEQLKTSSIFSKKKPPYGGFFMPSEKINYLTKW